MYFVYIRIMQKKKFYICIKIYAYEIHRNICLLYAYIDDMQNLSFLYMLKR